MTPGRCQPPPERWECSESNPTARDANGPTGSCQQHQAGAYSTGEPPPAPEPPSGNEHTAMHRVGVLGSGG